MEEQGPRPLLARRAVPQAIVRLRVMWNTREALAETVLLILIPVAVEVAQVVLMGTDRLVEMLLILLEGLAVMETGLQRLPEVPEVVQKQLEVAT